MAAVSGKKREIGYMASSFRVLRLCAVVLGCDWSCGHCRLVLCPVCLPGVYSTGTSRLRGRSLARTLPTLASLIGWAGALSGCGGGGRRWGWFALFGLWRGASGTLAFPVGARGLVLRFGALGILCALAFTAVAWSWPAFPACARSHRTL